jgi:hypothetical protein
MPMPKAREVAPGSAVLPAMRALTPNFVSHSARTKPVGPAPAIKTSQRAIPNIIRRHNERGPETLKACPPGRADGQGGAFESAGETNDVLLLQATLL